MYPMEQRFVEFLVSRAERFEDDVRTHDERVARGLAMPNDPFVESRRIEAPLIRDRIKELTIIGSLYNA